MNRNELLKKLTHLPASPGIYRFLGAGKKPLYIGKASSIRRRLASYLATSDKRQETMLEKAKSLKWQETASDIAAMILEAQLIKKYQPPYNIMLRDDKNYFYVGFTGKQFPRLVVTHQPAKFLISNSEFRNKFGKSKIFKPSRASKLNHLNFAVYSELKIRNSKFQSTFAGWTGPFTDGTALKTTLRLLRRIFPYCTCRQPHYVPCLNYHIGNCLGFCCLKNSQEPSAKSQEQYRKNIRAVQEILGGRKTLLVGRLSREMKNLADRQEFEKALGLQEKIEKMKRVLENAKIIGNRELNIENSGADNAAVLKELKRLFHLPALPSRIEGYDISNIQGTSATGAMVVFTDGVPDKSQYRKFRIRSTKHEALAVIRRC